jgi:hypothetical protein
MAAVVVVHGAFHELWGPHQIAHRWVPALQDGILLAGGELPDDAVTIAFYGDVFRPEPGTELADTELADLARRTGLLDAVTAVVGDDGLESLTEHVGREQVRRTVAQLGRYFGDPAVRAEVHRRLDDAIAADTRVVVAHSLGSVVAYEVLARRTGRPIDLVTIGSPLGQHAIIGTALQPPLVGGSGTWPSVVRCWTNVTAIGDPVADGHPVSAVFDGVVEVRVDNGHRRHDPEPYLCARSTGEAVAAGLSTA